jgi:hypothetical protein
MGGAVPLRDGRNRVVVLGWGAADSGMAFPFTGWAGAASPPAAAGRAGGRADGGRLRARALTDAYRSGCQLQAGAARRCSDDPVPAAGTAARRPAEPPRAAGTRRAVRIEPDQACRLEVAGSEDVHAVSTSFSGQPGPGPAARMGTPPRQLHALRCERHERSDRLWRPGSLCMSSSGSCPVAGRYGGWLSVALNLRWKTETSNDFLENSNLGRSLDLPDQPRRGPAASSPRTRSIHPGWPGSGC